MPAKKPETQAQQTGTDIYSDISAPPRGFDTAVATRQADGWWATAKGRIVCGRLLGRQEMKRRATNKKGAYYVIELYHKAHAVQGRGDEAETVVLDKGKIINVGERTQLEGLRIYADSDGVYDVWIKALGKQDIADGQTMWDFETNIKTIKSPSKMDDIPF